MRMPARIHLASRGLWRQPYGGSDRTDRKRRVGSSIAYMGLAVMALLNRVVLLSKTTTVGPRVHNNASLTCTQLHIAQINRSGATARSRDAGKPSCSRTRAAQPRIVIRLRLERLIAIGTLGTPEPNEQQTPAAT